MPGQNTSPYFQLSGQAERIRRNLVFASAFAIAFRSLDLDITSVSSIGIGITGLNKTSLFFLLILIIGYEIGLFISYFTDEINQWRQTFPFDLNKYRLSTIPSPPEQRTLLEHLTLAAEQKGVELDIEQLAADLHRFQKFWKRHSWFHYYVRILFIDAIVPVLLGIVALISSLNQIGMPYCP